MTYFVDLFNGRIAGLYSDDVGATPSGAVAISDAAGEFLSKVSNFGQYELVGGEPVKIYADIPSLSEFQRAHDAHLAAPAIARGFRDFDTFALRAGYPGPHQADAIVYAQWLDACDIFGKQLMADVIAGTVAAPSTTDDYLALLPVLVFPVME